MTKIKSSGSININYEEYGKNNGETILLIMGLGASGSAWEKHLNEYKKHFRCIVPDNRGAGESDTPVGDYSAEQMAADAVSVIDALGIDRFHVNGISMGGAVAQNIAVTQASRVKSCIITSSWAFCGNYMKSVFEMLKNTRKNLSYADFSRMFLLWLYSSKFYEDNPEYIEETIQNNINDPLPMPQRAFESQTAACLNHDTRGKLNKITAPVLITAGSRDIFTPLECSQYLHEHIKNSRLEIFDGFAHTHHWEDLVRYNKLTVDFFKSNK